MVDLSKQDCESRKASRQELEKYLSTPILDVPYSPFKQVDSDDCPQTPGRYDDVWDSLVLGDAAVGSARPTHRVPAPGEASSLDRTKTNGTTEEKIGNKCPKPVGVFVNKYTGRKYPISCGKWSCPHCGKIKKNRVVDRISRGFCNPKNGMRIRAGTLTQVLGSTRNIMSDWSTLRHALVRVGYSHLLYFWSKEFTKKGQRHLHFLVNAYIPQNVLKEAWQRATKGESYIVWMNAQDKPKMEEDIVHPGGYASKYLTKAYGSEVRFDQGEHRYGFSRHDLFKPLQKGNIGNLSPLEVLERSCLGSPFYTDFSLIGMISLYNQYRRDALVGG